MPDGRTLIAGGRVIDPANRLDKQTNLLLENRKVAYLGPDRPRADTVIDANGLLVTPGLIDMHVHLREPGHEEEETIASGTRAAAAGGFTSVACMANTHPPLDSEASIDFVLRQNSQFGYANVFPIGAITKGLEGKELAEMGSMVRAGAVAFSDDGNGIADTGVAFRAMQYVTMFDKVLIEHCEDPALAGGCINSGYVATVLGMPGRPGIAEQIMVYRDLKLAEAAGCRFHVAHLSTAEAVELVREAKRRNAVTVTAEAAPHHLVLTDEACKNFDPNCKVAPPLRTARDIEALKRGLADGTIDCLASDHAPHSREEKELEFLYAPFGLIGVETALGLYIKALIEPAVLDWPALIAKMTVNPARVLGIDKGHLSLGADADVTLIDPHRTWTVDVESFYSKSRNCPYHGWALQGKAVGAIVAGRIIHEEALNRQ